MGYYNYYYFTCIKSQYIIVTVNGKEYEAERGMTWKDFLDSIYNVDDFYYHHWDTPIAIIYDETNLQAINAGYNDEIIENTEYNIYKYRPNPS